MEKTVDPVSLERVSLDVSDQVQKVIKEGRRVKSDDLKRLDHYMSILEVNIDNYKRALRNS